MIAISVLAVGIVSAILIRSATSHFTYREMDWNDDGVTDVGELIDAINIDVRMIDRGGARCREYYSLKDGHPVNFRCDSSVAYEEEGDRGR